MLSVKVNFVKPENTTSSVINKVIKTATRMVSDADVCVEFLAILVT